MYVLKYISCNQLKVYIVLRDGLIDIDYIKLNTVILNIGLACISLI